MSEVALLDAATAIEEAPLPSHLEEARERLIKAGIPANTQRTYTDVLRRFYRWCAEHRQIAFPVTENALTGYIAYLTEQNCTPSTCRLVLSVVASNERAMADRVLPPSWVDAVDRMIRGHARTRTRKEGETKALPLIRDFLYQVAAVCETQGWRETLRGKRNALMMAIAYSLALRESELVGLNILDVENLGTGLKVFIRTSKTDKKSLGVYRTIPRGTFTPLEPVSLFEDYLAGLEEVGVDIHAPGVALFRGFNGNGGMFRARTVVTAHEGGRVNDYSRLGVRGVDEIFRGVCRMGMLSQWQNVSGHSPRGGFASTSAYARFPMPIWADWGRWAKTSRVPAQYVADALLDQEGPLRDEMIRL